MNKAIPAVIITAAGLGALASFRSSTGLPVKSAGAVVVPRTTIPSSAAPPSGGTTATPTTPATPAPATATQTRTITGDAVANEYGYVQVQVTLQGTKISDITVLQMPNSHQRSIEISQQAEPILRQEALQAQSATIDIVSGATFTSQSYAQSLQAALDQAKR